MHLDSFTLRGFKSFADRTLIELDRGLVAVVGPNGAGKSNLIDALIWCLGTLSTRALRAERMEDVIFTGTIGRPALGMAQVLLTFDNSSRTFPMDASQVQIGRTLFRDGASEYSLNGATCRLLDVQELLSEAGIGRELHAVVAQGQVDEIVSASPEQLRSFVEEAAGISKHRRRKEKALRKIEQVDADIARAADLLGELRRQIRPLRTQADQAVRHKEVSERLRELRIRLLVGELEDIDRERARSTGGREAASSALAELRTRQEALRNERAQAEARLDQARLRAAKMRRSLDHLRAAQTSALRAVLIMRERANAAPDARRRDAVAIKRVAVDAEEVQVRASLESAQSTLAEREAQVSALRSSKAAADAETAEASAGLAEVRQEATRTESEARSAEQTAITARAEAAAASERLDRADDRISRLQQQADLLRRDIETLDSDSGRAGMTVERLEAERTQSKVSFDEADRRLRAIDSERAVLSGRLESLRVARDLTASRRAGAEAFKTGHGVAHGVRGILGDSIRVASGLEAAVEAVLGPAVDALVVAGASLPRAVKAAEDERADVLLASTQAAVETQPAPAGVRRLSEVVEAPGWMRGTVDALLSGAVLADDWDSAVRLAASHPDRTFVTREGRVLSPRGVSRPARSVGHGVLGLGPAIDKAEEASRKLDAEIGRWTTNRDRHRRDLQRIETELEESRSVLHEMEGRIAAAADRLRELGAEEHGATLERDLASRDRSERLRTAESATAQRQDLLASAAVLREQETVLSERMAKAGESAAALESEAAGIREELTECLTTQASLTERLRGLERAREELRAEEAVHAAPRTDPEELTAAEALLSSTETLAAASQESVRELLAREESVEQELRTVAAEVSKVDVEVTAMEPRALRAAEDIARLDVRAEEIGSRLARDHDIPPSRARAEFPLDGDAEAQEAEASRLEAELRRMGPVNPLAAQELVALDERQAFLEAQIEDLRRSRRDLMKLVRAATERMREMLVTAVQDADVRFREVAGLLFPEGDGRLRLVESEEDPLEGGLEIEVRLGRKGHRRLAFLSGGEKALAGLGFLFALHLARPTPFLVLDEVDAPLDDANLGRFLRLLDSLRTQTQVLVVTHQKRTMERADSLIGVTLNPDGTSRVVTQKLQEPAVRDGEEAGRVLS
ncbi:MAG TPA: chromosome segregation protein SMC [Actinomycetota bacterium]|nr:chromosome segregation protein SMC [Actinomycetota bacterium]